MSVTISDHQARVYGFAKARAGQWLTVQEISVSTNVPENTVKGHAARFEEIGIFERIRISPSHAFRLDADADKHAQKMVARLNEAVEIFSARRLAWLKREEGVVRKLDADISSANSRIEFEDSDAAPPMLAVAGEVRVRTESADIVTPELDALKVVEPSPENLAPALPPVSSERTPNGETAKVLPAPKQGNKVDLMLTMVSRQEGASLDELVAALGNQAHSIRASISVESRKRALTIECLKGRYYLRAPNSEQHRAASES